MHQCGCDHDWSGLGLVESNIVQSWSQSFWYNGTSFWSQFSPPSTHLLQKPTSTKSWFLQSILHPIPHTTHAHTRVKKRTRWGASPGTHDGKSFWIWAWAWAWETKNQNGKPKWETKMGNQKPKWETKTSVRPSVRPSARATVYID